jgi:hypothetical protein
MYIDTRFRGAPWAHAAIGEVSIAAAAMHLGALRQGKLGCFSVEKTLAFKEFARPALARPRYHFNRFPRVPKCDALAFVEHVQVLLIRLAAQFVYRMRHKLDQAADSSVFRTVYLTGAAVRCFA